jgi:hypothetical protein
MLADFPYLTLLLFVAVCLLALVRYSQNCVTIVPLILARSYSQILVCLLKWGTRRKKRVEVARMVQKAMLKITERLKSAELEEVRCQVCHDAV